MVDPLPSDTEKPSPATLRRVVEGLKDFLEAIEKDTRRNKNQDEHPLADKLSKQMKSVYHKTFEKSSNGVFRKFRDWDCARLMFEPCFPLAAFFIEYFYMLHSITLRIMLCPSMRNSARACVAAGLDDLLGPLVQTCLELSEAGRPLPLSPNSLLMQEELKLLMNPNTDAALQQEPIIKPTITYPRRGIPYSTAPTTNPGFFNFLNLDHGHKVEIGDPLGEGGFATVYKGRLMALGQGSQPNIDVAVKMFDIGVADCGSSEKWISSMEQLTTNDIQGDLDPACKELLQLLYIEHPNIIRPYGYIGKRGDYGECGLVMELMDESLYDFLERANDHEEIPFTRLEMLYVLLEVGTGMRFLHEYGLMHRDLNPRNILLRWVVYSSGLPRGCRGVEVKLADFGFLKPVLSPTEEELCAASQVGSRFYMAPEVRSGTGTPYTEKADVFSYGSTCFNLLICDPIIYTGTIDGFYLDYVNRGNWKNLAQLEQYQAPRYLVELVERCWQPDPNLRPTFKQICGILKYFIKKHLDGDPPEISDSLSSLWIFHPNFEPWTPHLALIPTLFHTAGYEE